MPWTRKSSTLCQGPQFFVLENSCSSQAGYNSAFALLSACTGLQNQLDMSKWALWGLCSTWSPLCLNTWPSKSLALCQTFSKNPMDIPLPRFPFVSLSQLFAPTGIEGICDIKLFLLIVFNIFPRDGAFELWIRSNNDNALWTGIFHYLLWDRSNNGYALEMGLLRCFKFSLPILLGFKAIGLQDFFKTGEKGMREGLV